MSDGVPWLKDGQVRQRDSGQGDYWPAQSLWLGAVSNDPSVQLEDSETTFQSDEYQAALGLFAQSSLLAEAQRKNSFAEQFITQEGGELSVENFQQFNSQAFPLSGLAQRVNNSFTDARHVQRNFTDQLDSETERALEQNLVIKQEAASDGCHPVEKQKPGKNTNSASAVQRRSLASTQGSVKDENHGESLACDDCHGQLYQKRDEFFLLTKMSRSTPGDEKMDLKKQNTFLLDVLFDHGGDCAYHVECILKTFRISKGRLRRLREKKRKLLRGEPLQHGLTGRASNNRKRPETLQQFLDFVVQCREAKMIDPRGGTVYGLKAGFRCIQGDSAASLRVQFNLHQQRLSTAEHPRETISSGTAQAWFKRHCMDTLPPGLSQSLNSTASDAESAPINTTSTGTGSGETGSCSGGSPGSSTPSGSSNGAFMLVTKQAATGARTVALGDTNGAAVRKRTRSLELDSEEDSDHNGDTTDEAEIAMAFGGRNVGQLVISPQVAGPRGIDIHDHGSLNDIKRRRKNSLPEQRLAAFEDSAANRNRPAAGTNTDKGRSGMFERKPSYGRRQSTPALPQSSANWNVPQVEAGVNPPYTNMAMFNGSMATRPTQHDGQQRVDESTFFASAGSLELLTGGHVGFNLDAGSNPLGTMHIGPSGSSMSDGEMNMIASLLSNLDRRQSESRSVMMPVGNDVGMGSGYRNMQGGNNTGMYSASDLVDVNGMLVDLEFSGMGSSDGIMEPSLD